MAWFPIATAPPDGTVLIAEIVDVPIGGPVIWQLQGAMHIQEVPNEWFDLQGDFSISWKPTHWRPMPSADIQEDK